MRPSTFSGFIDSGLGYLKLPFIYVPQEIGDAWSDGNMTRIVCTFESGLKKHSALRKTKDGQYIVSLSKAFLKELKKQVGEEVEVALSEDTTKYGMPMPEEWQAFMDQDEAIKTQFEALSDGKIRGYLHYLGTPKTEQGRINRCLDFAEKLRSNTLHSF